LEGDEIAFRVEGQRVTVVPVGASHEDPVVEKFLSFLAHDIEKHPEVLKPFSKDFATHMKALVKRTKVDLNEPIDGDVDLCPMQVKGWELFAHSLLLDQLYKLMTAVE
jgi:antitoxin PrlF